MPPVKDLTKSAEKFGRRAGAAGQDYSAGIQSPRTPWKAATAAAVGTWNTAITTAVGQNSFGKGVDKATDEEWRSAALNKGASRYGPGAQAAAGKWGRKFAPFAAVIQGVSLTPRGPKGDPGNLNRVAQIANALHSAKVGS